MPQPGHILSINAGSSSIKFALFSREPLKRIASGGIDRIGSPQAQWSLKDAAGQTTRESLASTSEPAATQLLSRLAKIVDPAEIAVGHRIVHGGPDFIETQRVGPALVAGLRKIEDFDPEHLPSQIALIEAVTQSWPAAPQVACFDTAFHATMPTVARTLALPRRLQQLGVRRYGFHGISYSYLVEELAHVAGPATAAGRTIFMHLGNGASMAAVRAGRCLDTTMAFTPTAGLPMSTRCGDFDPGVGYFLQRTQGLSDDGLFHMLNRESGLLGVSETSSDMRDLLEAQSHDPRAAEAIELFCYAVRKWIGAFAAVLEGLDTLVFSGGIGENAAPVREAICRALGWLGVRLDAAANTAASAVISAPDSRITVRVIKTDEELMIARSVKQIVAEN